MHVIQARNVNDAYMQGMQYLVQLGMRSPSRAGEVLVLNTPVTTIYNRPTERVLFEPNRDANPFFHLFESIWMLAGRRDATYLDRFVSDFSKRFAEDNGEAHGAYGYRWRNHFRGEAVKIGESDANGANIPIDILEFPAIDQITKVGDILFDDPTSRQAVIAMWDPSVDLGAKKRDIPCNDLIMFRTHWDAIDQCHVLDMTVCCRSNDAVWGAYGANAVHMSFMGEIVAGLAGMRFGRYYQISNNFHVYLNILEKVWPAIDTMDPYTYGMAQSIPLLATSSWHYKSLEGRQKVREMAQRFVEDCEVFIKNEVNTGSPSISHLYSAWFMTVAFPMLRLHDAWKKDKNTALSLLSSSLHQWDDWKHAASQWMTRRMNPRIRNIDDVRAK